LLKTITTLARSRGIQRFTAEVLAGNTAMQAVFRRSGMTQSSASSDGVGHYVLSPASGEQ
jgi:RimJ/RimL family protein N-acetyltransferase